MNPRYVVTPQGRIGHGPSDLGQVILAISDDKLTAQEIANKFGTTACLPPHRVNDVVRTLHSRLATKHVLQAMLAEMVATGLIEVRYDIE